MTSNVAGILILFSVCGLVLPNPNRAFDCRKFVFAPQCRGVSAKRADVMRPELYEPTSYGSDESTQDILKLFSNVKPQIEEYDEENQKGDLTAKQNELRNTVKSQEKAVGSMLLWLAQRLKKKRETELENL